MKGEIFIMSNLELLASIKMSNQRNAFGESAVAVSDIKWDEFYNSQKKTIEEYKKYIDVVISNTTNIEDDMEVKVITEIPIFQEDIVNDLIIKFERAENTVTDITEEELYMKDVKDTAVYPMKETVTSLSSYIEKYNIFIKGLKKLAFTLKGYLNDTEVVLQHLIDSDKTDSDKVLKFYLSSMRIIRYYMIELVSYGEAFKNTLDD